MDWTAIITTLITAIGSAFCAYLAIVPQIKKNKIAPKDIENAINNSSSMKVIKDGLVTEMRKSLISEYWTYSNNGFDMTQSEIDSWNDDIKKYKALGGNGVITELDSSLQMALLQRSMSKNDQRARKL